MQTVGDGSLQLVALPVKAPPTGHVRVRVEACGVCHTDAGVIAGSNPRIAYPCIPGHEVVGHIDAVGEGVGGRQVGQRVGVYGGLSDEPTLFDRLPVLAKGISLTGYLVGQILRRPDRLARGQAFVRKHLASGAIMPQVERVFPLAEATETHRYMESNVPTGKIVLTI